MKLPKRISEVTPKQWGITIILGSLFILVISQWPQC